MQAAGKPKDRKRIKISERVGMIEEAICFRRYDGMESFVHVEGFELARRPNSSCEK